MNELVTNFLIGAGTGGALQGVSEILKIGHGVVDIFKGMSESLIARNDADSRNRQAEAYTRQKAQDAAAKRSPVWLRAVLAIIVFVSAFILSYVYGWFGKVTSIIYELPARLNLGIIKLGGGMKALEVNGFVMTPEFSQVVVIITGAVFGIGAIRTGKNLR